MLDNVLLRRPEPKDSSQLYVFRNDWEVIQSLGGFSTGYSLRDVEEWIEFHRKSANEIIWVIADKNQDLCLGHVGLYNIDYRVRKADFAILIGDKSVWGKGLGKSASQAVLDYGFDQVNLHRIELQVLANNVRAIHLYKKLGFTQEGILRDAQFRNSRHIDVITMSILEHERNRR